MIRTLAAILCALNAQAPTFPHKGEAAPLLRELARRHEFDPFTMVAYVHGESRWQPDAVNPSSGATGLGQILPRDAEDQERLLEWRYNLTRSAAGFSTWREFCRERVGSPLAVHWLQGIGGWDVPQKTTCGHRWTRRGWVAVPVPRYVTNLMAKRRALIRRCAP